MTAVIVLDVFRAQRYTVNVLPGRRLKFQTCGLGRHHAWTKTCTSYFFELSLMMRTFSDLSESTPLTHAIGMFGTWRSHAA